MSKYVVERNGLANGRNPLAIVAAVVAIAQEVVDNLPAGSCHLKVANCINASGSGTKQRYDEVKMYLLSSASQMLNMEFPPEELNTHIPEILNVCFPHLSTLIIIIIIIICHCFV